MLTNKNLSITALVLVSTVLTASAQASSAAVSSSCATLEFMAKMLAINILLPANRDRSDELTDMRNQMLAMNQMACQPVLLTENARYDSRYENGRRVSTDLYQNAWYFPNGRLFVARPGRDTAVYYPNGQAMAFSWMRGGQTIYWPNGNPATFSFRTINEPWYYPDGHIVTYLAGRKGERWFYPFARLDGQVGQELISGNWGKYDEYVSLIQYTPNGIMYMRRERIRDKLVLSDEELLDVPGVILMLTRLYQAPDEARLFIPGDGSITGSPW
jgi:hypothetical protein